jgi:hypothetical protein
LLRAGANGNSSSFVNTNFNNFAPRLGLAYDTSGKGHTVIRGGYGIFYFLDRGGVGNELSNNPEFNGTLTYNAQSGYRITFTGQNTSTLPPESNCINNAAVCDNNSLNATAALPEPITNINEAAPTSDLLFRIATLEFTARLEEAVAPKTCEAFRKLLPLKMNILHCRWSGEACWIPLGKWEVPLDGENETCHPAPGQILLYAAGPSEPELLIPYGACAFSSKIGQLAGNHFLTIVDEQERLRKLGHLVLGHGAQECVIERVADR